MKTLFCTFVLGVSALSAMAANDTEQATNHQLLTLEKIMADPDWIGNSPESAYFSDDGKFVYYKQKIQGNKERRQFKLKLEDQSLNKVSDSELFQMDAASGSISPDGKLKVYNLRGDLYLKYLASGEVRQLTQTHANEGRPIFIGNSKVAYRHTEDYYTIDLSSGLISQLVDIQLQDAPKNINQPAAYLEKQQTRYFEYIRKIQNQRKHDDERAIEIAESSLQDADAPWYLGKGAEIHTMSLSPNGRWLIVGTYDKTGKDGESDNMPRFVTEDGYVENANVRTLVGTAKLANESLYLLDLKSHTKTLLDYAGLPFIDNDPMASIKRETAKLNGETYKPHKGPRSVEVFDWIASGGVEWSDDGNKVAVMLYSTDNKDRWLTEVDLKNKQLNTVSHLRDKAWINDWNFNDFGWLNDNQSIYFTSEKSGFSQLYLKQAGKKVKALTKGRFIVDSVQLSADGKYLYYRANKKHPGIYEVYRVEPFTGKTEAMTNLGGKNDYQLSLDGRQMIIEHSEALKPMDLYLTSTNSSSQVTQLTNVVSDKFKSISWAKPQFVEIPSSEADQPIYGRLYTPKDFDANRAEEYPAVIFIHGAGYLQNAHQGWSLYFREFMFHTFLTQQGYVVLDMDYRASAGYGRDWRTAIYRQMGTPEVVDLKDGANWLADKMSVNREKVGIYGGSYGGFLTFMALFTAPDDFAAGAALRPVTDWAHYNHGYTSNILNTPETDPMAFEKSSPIEYAEGLNKPLLIAHGMVDDNVFFKDSVRLVQRLIELEKSEYFETAIYPIEPHGFKEPSSWLDEYKRIYYLFEDNLK